ncbi:MAG: Hsp20/alpha crystallin family protein [Acidimicrobiales bacterium]|jgi:HSP20 family protein
MTVPDRRVHGDRTAVARWEPFAELDRLTRQLSDLLDTWNRFPQLLPEGFTPLADVEETSDAYVVDVELPGVKRNDINIEVAGRRLTIHGERKERERVGILRRRERTVGRFHYEVTLPGDVEEDAVEAHLDEGVLTVRLPKPERERPRRIPVQTPPR